LLRGEPNGCLRNTHDTHDTHDTCGNESRSEELTLCTAYPVEAGLQL
jgi:hypothetical protein